MSEERNTQFGYKKTPTRKENKQVNFRVSEEEYDKLKQSADVLNMSVAQYAKAKAKGSHLVKPKFSAENQKKIITMMSQLSNNTNQIARALNKNDNFSDERINTNLAKLTESWNEIWQLLN